MHFVSRAIIRWKSRGSGWYLHWSVLGLALLVGIAGCSTPEPSSLAETPIPTLLSPPIVAPYPGRPWTLNGVLIGTDVISMLAGNEGCGFDTVTLMTFGRPLGETFATSDDAVQYVRDPGNGDSNALVAPFEASSELSPGAMFTGYRYGSDELWVDAGRADVVFLVRGTVVETWPRAREAFACG